MCYARGHRHSNAMLGLPQPKAAVPSGANALSPQLGVGGNLSVTVLTTAVHGQCPLLTQSVCSANLVEGLQMFLAT